MLLSYSPEGAFVTLLFELVLSGLTLLVAFWIQLSQTDRAGSPGQRTLSLGFALLTAACATRVIYCRVAVCSSAQVDPSHFWLLFVSDEARLLAAASLVSGFLLQGGRRWPARVLLAGAAALGAFAIFRFSADAAASVRSIVPVTTMRASEVGVLLFGVALLGGSRGVQPLAAVLLLGTGRAVALLAAQRPTISELGWGIEHAATIAGLILLALTLEREIRQTALRVFLRLNLTFLVLASSLILVVTEIERRRSVEFSALHLEDLAEFVRGHMLYYSHRGESADQALTREDVTRKLVAEFGRYPDLRRVQVSMAGRTMALTINDRGEIEQAFWTGDRAVPPRVSPADFAIAPLLRVPIVSRGEPVGNVQLDHSLERINQKIGWQMQIIFAVFTVFVAVGTVVTGMLVLSTDRTIRRQYDELEGAQRRLSLAERLASIGAVADGVAHEINNPAGILVARSDYLLSVVRDSPVYAEIRDDLETIRRQAQRIARTVKDLLTFTRPGRLCRELLDLREVIDSAAALVQPLLAGRSVAIECRLAPELGLVCGDRNRLEQVFINLLINAIHAIGDAGQIVIVAARRPGGGVDVRICDTGIGISSEHLDRIFDPFFTTKEPGVGIGLGLSIAYGIIRDHGGSIDVSSTLGQGTQFVVALPVATAACPGDQSREGSSAGARMPGSRQPELEATTRG